MVKIETGSRIPVCGSRGLRYVDEIWFADRCWPLEESDFIKYEAGSSIAPPQLPSWKSIRGRIVVTGGPIWMKFGIQVEFDLLKTVTSTSTKPEPVWSRRGRHLEIVNDVISPLWVTRFGRNLVVSCKHTAQCNYSNK